MPRECARGKRAFLLLMRAMLLPVDRASCPRREHVPSRGRTRAGTELRRAADAPSQHAWAEQTDRSKTQRALLRVPWQQSGALAITYARWMLAGCWCSGAAIPRPPSLRVWLRHALRQQRFTQMKRPLPPGLGNGRVPPAAEHAKGSPLHTCREPAIWQLSMVLRHTYVESMSLPLGAAYPGNSSASPTSAIP